MNLTNWLDFEEIEPKITKRLNGLHVDSPLALPTVLSSSKLTKESPLLKIVSISVICKDVDSEIIVESMSNTQLLHTQKNNYLILTGSLYDWVFSILYCCSNNVSKDLRRLYNIIYVCFNNSDVKNLWRDYERIVQDDKTIILRTKS